MRTYTHEVTGALPTCPHQPWQCVTCTLPNKHRTRHATSDASDPYRDILEGEGPPPTPSRKQGEVRMHVRLWQGCVCVCEAAAAGCAGLIGPAQSTCCYLRTAIASPPLVSLTSRALRLHSPHASGSFRPLCSVRARLCTRAMPCHVPYVSHACVWEEQGSTGWAGRSPRSHPALPVSPPMQANRPGMPSAAGARGCTASSAHAGHRASVGTYHHQ